MAAKVGNRKEPAIGNRETAMKPETYSLAIRETANGKREIPCRQLNNCWLHYLKPVTVFCIPRHLVTGARQQKNKAPR
jgi:hypothetical protein